MEQTDALRDLFAHYRQDAGGVVQEAASCRSPSRPSPRLRPLQEAAAVVSRTVHAAIDGGYRRVRAAMQAMGEPGVGPLGRVERGLLLGEAELLSASASVEEFSSAVQAALKQVEAESQSSRLAFFSTFVRDRRPGDEPPPSAQLLEHYRELLQCLSSRLSQCRLTVTLCKEELALCKSETFLFSRCGVLSCEDSLLSDTTKTANFDFFARFGAGKAGGREEAGGAEKNVDAVASSPKARDSASGGAGSLPLEGFGIVRSVSKHTKFLMEDIVKKATDTVKVAGDSVISIARTGLAQNSFKDADGGPFRGSGGIGSDSGVSNLPVVPHFQYTKEEEQRLREENVLLLHRQHEASVRDAKEVEASVRELSQLTLLMNEKVMQQGEQFSILVKNTEEARHVMQSSVEELMKPTKGFWNPERQLVALLWISTVFILFANYLVR